MAGGMVEERSTNGAAAAPLRILMLGNSLTVAHDIPAQLAEALGAEVTVHARGGAHLTEHLHPITKLGSLTLTALDTEKWDYVILQEMSKGPAIHTKSYLGAVAGLSEKIYAAGARPIVYGTWAYAQGSSILAQSGMTYEEMFQRMRDACAQAATDNNALLVDACTAFYESTDPASLYEPDGCHPSEAGAALVVELMVEAIESDQATASA